VLLLVTIGLVLVAAVSLVIGFAGNQLRPIEFSILCSSVAAVVLFFSSRLAQRRGAEVTTAKGPAPLPVGPQATAEFDRVSAGSPRAAPVEPRPSQPAQPARPAPPVQYRAADHDDGHGYHGQDFDDKVDFDIDLRSPASIENLEDNEDPEELEDDWDDDEAVFPIEDYDELRVAEIVPLLYELDDYELEEVRARELAGRRRASVVTRIDQILAGDQQPALATAPAPPAPPTSPDRPALRPRPAPSPPPLPPARQGPRPRQAPPAGSMSPTRSAPPARTPAAAAAATAAAGTTALRPARITAAPRTASQTSRPSGADRWADRRAPFPIADYDELRVAEILPLLVELEPDELERVAARERRGANRTTILGRIDRLQWASEDEQAPPVAALTGRGRKYPPAKAASPPAHPR
jgi:hypothetical protein